MKPSAAEKSQAAYIHEIHKLNSFLKIITNGAVSYAVLLDRDAKILYYSDSLLKLAQIEDNIALIGMPLLDAYQRLFSDQSTISEATRRLSRVMSGENEFFEDDIITWPTGEKSIYRITYKRFQDANCDLDAILFFARDITDIRLEEAERRLNDVLHSSTLPCMIWDETGRTVAYNKEATRIFCTPMDLSIDEFNDVFLAIQPERQSDGQETEAIRKSVIHEALEKGFSQVTVWLQNANGTPLCFTVNVTRIAWLFGCRLIVYYYDHTDEMLKEAEAREVEKQIRLVLDAAPLGVLLLHDDFSIIDCNDALMKMFDNPNKKILIDDLLRFSPKLQPDGQLSRVKAAGYLNKAYESGYASFEWMHQNYYGEPIPTAITFARIKNGNKSSMVYYILDLREHNKMVQEISAANERMQFMFNSMPLTANIFDKDINVVDCNQACVELFGTSSKEEYISRFYDLAPEYQPCGRTSKEVVFEEFSKAVENGYNRVEYLHQTLNEEQIPCEVVLIRMQYKDEFYVLGYAWDLRKMKTALAEANEANERMKLMLDVNPMMCIMRDDQDNIIDCNQETLKILEVASKADFCKNYYSFFPEFQPDGSRSTARTKEVNQILDREGSIQMERSFQTRTGELIPAETKIVRIPWKNAYYDLSFSQDLRKIKAEEQKKLESMAREREAKIQREVAQAANEAKSQFLANMSHEIRTPMNSIIGFAELAMDDDISPRIKDYLGKILANSTWLLQIINDILDISKIESGKIELENIPFSMQSIFMRCQSVIHPIIIEKGLDLQVFVDPQQGKKLLGDPLRLYQALMNLLANAVKFTDAGTVIMSSSTLMADDSTTTVYFEVKDSGIGMNAKQMERIFEPFIQADSSTTRHYGGTGLGLAIIKNIVELMGGRLAVESTPGVGSTFSFELTFETIDAPEDMPGQTIINVVEKPHFDGLILLCEDNPMNQQVICEHLARVGLKTVVAANGKIGVERVQERMSKEQKPFDLIFMDMFMPVMNGLEAASKIAALGTGSPIVAMTANVMTSERANYKRNGMSGYVGKPFTSQELWRCLLEYLTPVRVSVVDAADHTQDNDLLQKKLRIHFVKDNQTTFQEITAALAAGDLPLAHRLAHTVKTSAGLIGKTRLQNTAADIEAMLKNETVPTAGNHLSRLEAELQAVFEELQPVLDEAAAQTRPESLNGEQALVLFAKLQPMLENINPECANLLDEIRAVPGSEELARQIEDYDFASAARTLDDLKKKWA